MNANEFARRVQSKLDGKPLILPDEDAALLQQCGIAYTSSAPVLFDSAAHDQLEAVGDVLTRNYGASVRVYLPVVDG